MIGLCFSILAFKNTLLASVSMIFVLSIVSTTAFSICFLKVRYFWNHYLAMLVCAVGVFITVITDLRDSNGNFSFGNGWGDLCAAIAALSYGTTSVVIDYILRNKGNYFSMTAYIGFFGAIYTFLIFFIAQEFFVFGDFSSHSDHSYLSLLFYLVYALAGFGIYTFNILLIQISTATVFHLILLCGTLYGMVYDTLIFDRTFVGEIFHFRTSCTCSASSSSFWGCCSTTGDLLRIQSSKMGSLRRRMRRLLCLRMYPSRAPGFELQRWRSLSD